MMVDMDGQRVMLDRVSSHVQTSRVEVCTCVPCGIMNLAHIQSMANHVLKHDKVC